MNELTAPRPSAGATDDDLTLGGNVTADLAPPPGTEVWDGADTHGDRRARAVPVIVVLAVFAASRALAYVAGVRFNAGMLHRAWQILDPRLLEDHLAESIWYLHMQPPLFNLFIGVLLKVSPLSDELTLHVAWVAMGAGLSVLLYVLGRQLGLGRWTAVITASVITCGSTVLLYEHWFQYEYPLMLVVTGCVSAFIRWQRTGKASALALTCGLAASAVLMRSLFHPAWLVGVVALALLARPLGIRRARPTPDDVDEAPAAGLARRRLAVGAAALVPLLLVGGLMVKNQALFGRSELSSWFGWNLNRIISAELTPEDKQQLVDEGSLPPTFNGWINQPLDRYEAFLGPCRSSRPDVAVLSEPTKSVPPEVEGQALDNNLNHECYLRVYDAFQKDSIAFIKLRPKSYATNVVTAFELWAMPTTDYVFVRENAREVGWLDNAYKAGVLLAVPIEPPVETKAIRAHVTCIRLPDMEPICMVPDGQYRFSLTIVGGTLLAGVLMLWGAWQVLVRRRREHAVWVLIGSTIVWVTLVGNLFEIQENHRFRSVVEPLTILLVVATIAAVVRRLRARRSGPGPENAESPSGEGLTADLRGGGDGSRTHDLLDATEAL